MEFHQFQTTKKMKDVGIKSGHRKGPPSMEKDRALHYQPVNDKNVPQPCPLGPWALPDSQVRQAVGSHWIPPITLLITDKTNQIQYLRLPEP